MRGLDNTCTSPCDWRKLMSAAKLLVWKARPNNVPGTPAPVMTLPGLPGVEVNSELRSGLPSGPIDVNVLIAPCVERLVAGCCMPPAKRLLGPAWKAAQLMPVAKLSL